MEIRYYIGIDVSNNTLDWAVYADQRMVWQTQSENSSVAIRAVIKQLQALDCFRNTNCVVCIEHAGLYNAHALEVLFQANSRFGWRLPYTLNKRVDYNEANPIALMLNVLLNMLMAFGTAFGCGNLHALL